MTHDYDSYAIGYDSGYEHGQKDCKTRFVKILKGYLDSLSHAKEPSSIVVHVTSSLKDNVNRLESEVS